MDPIKNGGITDLYLSIAMCCASRQFDLVPAIHRCFNYNDWSN